MRINKVSAEREDVRYPQPNPNGYAPEFRGVMVKLNALLAGRKCCTLTGAEAIRLTELRSEFNAILSDS